MSPHQSFPALPSPAPPDPTVFCLEHQASKSILLPRFAHLDLMQSGLVALVVAVCTVPSAAVLHLPAHAVALKASNCPFGYGEGCGGGGAVDPATKAKVASILEGILKNLSNKKATF